MFKLKKEEADSEVCRRVSGGSQSRLLRKGLYLCWKELDKGPLAPAPVWLRCWRGCCWLTLVSDGASELKLPPLKKQLPVCRHTHTQKKRAARREHARAGRAVGGRK